MQIQMHLNESPFERIKNGQKKVEGRINDKKRQNLKVKDEIIFISRETGEKVKAIITRLEKFRNFGDMFEGTETKLWATKIKTKKEFVDSFSYYKNEKIKEYGTLAIYFDLIKIEDEFEKIVELLNKVLPKLLENPEIMRGCDVSEEEIENIIKTKKLSLKVLGYLAGDRFFEWKYKDFGISEDEAYEIANFSNHTAKDFYEFLKSNFDFLEN